MTDKPGLDMSFSGLKTHTRNLINEQDIKIPKVKHDICAGFQEAVIDTLITKCKRAIEANRFEFIGYRRRRFGKSPA